MDAAQGREADALVFSCVRSNSEGRTGFVERISESYVRFPGGRYLLTIFGDASFFERAGGPFSDVLTYMRSHPSSCNIKEL